MKRVSIPFSVSIAGSWQFISTAIIVAAGVGLLLFGRLDSMLPGYGATEVASAKASQSLAQIIDNPVNAPYKLTVYSINSVINDPLFATRIAAALFGTATLALFYIGIRHWHAKRVAFLATALFAASAWFLHTARFGSPDILQPLAVLLFATCGYWIASVKRSNLRYIAAMLALSFCIYVPGVLWLLALGLVVRQKKDIRLLTLRLPMMQRALLALATLTLVAVPLMVAIVRNPSVGLELLGFPESWPNPLEFLHNIAMVPASLVAWSDFSPEYWLGHLPLLDIFAAAMLGLGVYYYFKFRALDRAKFIGWFLLVVGALIALGGPVSYAMLLPVAYILAAGGIALLIAQWKTVFPRNPLAHSIAYAFVTVAVVVSAIYNLRAYFVAWPYNSDVKATYQKTEQDLLQ